MAPLSDDLSARLTAALAGRYEIQRELGAGGMAIVFLASDVRHRRQVAIKVLRPELGTVKGPERFLREIGIAAMLVHPNIVPLFDSGEADGLPYYVMPYVAGESLKDRLRRETQLPLDDALHIACQVAEALAYAHDRGVLHRDIKPANILLSGGDALVADFGLARAIGALDSEDLTRTGLALGTPLYMSPEQASAAGALDGRTDVYSLACVLYEMLVGTPPFNGATPGAILARHSLEPVPSMRVVRSTIPAQVERAVARALAKTPADRFATARQFAQALEIARDPQGARWSWLGVTLPGGRRAARTAAAAVMIAVVATLAVVTWQRAHAPSPPDSHALAVLPFRRAQSGAGVAAGLARDLAALVAQRLPGTGGVRAIDAATVAAALARVGTGDTVVPTVADARRVGREVGAGRLLVGDIRRDGDRLVVGATVLATADGAVVVRTDEVAGPADRLAGLADRLAAEILARAAGESGERLRTLLGTSLPALRAYLAGQEALERGAFTEAARRFGEALDADSTFPLAALGMYAAGPFLSETLQLRGSQAAWAGRGRLGPDDRLLLRAQLGPSPTESATMQEEVQHWREAADAMPERPEVWYGLGHAILTDGPWIGMPDINGAASAALRRALQRNPSYVPALGDLLEIACSDGDTTQVRALAARYLARDSTGEFADYYRWRVATTLADTATLTSLRRRFDTFSEASLHRIITVAQIEGLGTAEALRAVAALRRTSDFGRYLHFEVLQNAGRFRDAAEARRMTGGPEPRSTPSQRLGRTVEALYWTGDTMRVQALLERAAPRLDARPVRRDADPADTVFYDVCALGIWRLARGETRGVAHLAALLHNVRDPMRHFPTAYIGICAAVMDAALAAAEHSLHAALRLQRLDSLMATGPLATTWPILAGNLTAARLFERAGRLDAALVALGRRVRLTAFGDIRYLVALPLVLREEGRLMALTGDTASAIRAYRRYLALRDTPDLAVRPEVDSVRSALARLKKRT